MIYKFMGLVSYTLAPVDYFRVLNVEQWHEIFYFMSPFKILPTRLPTQNI